MFNKCLLVSFGIICLLIFQTGIILAAPGSDDWIDYYRYPVADKYATAISYATSSWNSCGGGVIIAAVSSLSSAEVGVSTYNSATDGYDGNYLPRTSGPDLITLNDYYLGGWMNDHRQSTIGHEFGHGWPLVDQPRTAQLLMNGYNSARWDQYKINVPKSGDVTNLINR